jgi:hypothetical protein
MNPDARFAVPSGSPSRRMVPPNRLKNSAHAEDLQWTRPPLPTVRLEAGSLAAATPMPSRPSGQIALEGLAVSLPCSRYNLRHGQQSSSPVPLRSQSSP